MEQRPSDAIGKNSREQSGNKSRLHLKIGGARPYIIHNVGPFNFGDKKIKYSLELFPPSLKLRRGKRANGSMEKMQK